jgi:hypothetical protein
MILVLTTSCGRDEIRLEGFDSDQWREDRFSCAGRREQLSAALMNQREKLLAHDELEIVDVLGKPDENELYKRNEKFYYYYIQPAAKCNTPADQPKRLIIRFNSVGLAKEILIE